MKDPAPSSLFSKRNVIIAILVLCLLLGGIVAVRGWLSKKESEETEPPETTEVIEIPTETEPPETTAPYVSPIDFAALWEKNPDTVGWIRIPDTVIDYPIVYDPEDNEHYLHVDFDGNESVYGAIYLDSDSEPDFSGWNNPIYGHHMKNGSMFKGISYFKEQDYFRAHQFFEIYTPERTIHLKAVACYYSSADGIVRQTMFDSQRDFDKWVEDRLSPCSFRETLPYPVDSMFVLVTCSYEMENARTLLFAVEVDENGNQVPADPERAQKRIKPLETLAPRTAAAPEAEGEAALEIVE